MLSEGRFAAIVEAALDEDLAGGDLTSRLTVPADRTAAAAIVAKGGAIFCGGPVAKMVFERVDPSLRVDVVADEAEAVPAGSELVRIVGSARSILAAERTALNLLQRACGVASVTRLYVNAAGGRARIVDTRKTMPGLRALDRYAVRCGGGRNHRNDLGAGVLIKENHIRAAGGVRAAVSAALEGAPHTTRVECEVQNLDELEDALIAGARAVLLDNMDDATVQRAVAQVQRRALVEVSGGITLERIPRLAALGVDLISVGALTHSVPPADLSLLFEP